MGSNEDIMHKFANKELKSVFPSIDGWTVRKVTDFGKDLEGFLATKKVYGQQLAVNVIVSFDRTITADAVDAIKTQRAANRKNVLLVPQGTDITAVAGGIDVLFMRSFGYEGEQLIWLKRHAMTPAQDDVARAS
jgi:hypothetical protein